MSIFFPLEIEELTTETLSYSLVSGWSKSFPNLDSENTLVVVFAAHEYHEYTQPLLDLRQAFPTSKIIGGSSLAVIHEGKLLDGAISVGVIRFKNTQLRFSSAPVKSLSESLEAGQQISKQLAEDHLKGILIFSDGVTTEATELVRGLQTMLPPDIPIMGGLVSGQSLDHTWLICDGELTRFYACAVGFIGHTVELTRATGGGWRLIGEECKATRTCGRTLFELDGEPANVVYQRQVGAEMGFGLREASTRYPLTIRLPSLEMQIVRDINFVNEEAGILELAGDIPEGVTVQVMTTTDDEILDGVDEAIERMRSQTILPPKMHWQFVSVVQADEQF
ncbi:MAG: hypothetical protein HC810_02690 [Acaryochloridaceae cyanobacterium RL_2_7]|nr:hypothetical protein [Acaryochloridaceae cyanobacterium RL_2_7]